MAYESDVTRMENREVTSADLSGVRTARVFGFVVDYLIIGLLSLIPFAIGLLLTLVTLGLAAPLLSVIVPVVALVYLAMTLGSSKQSTIGMRMFGVRLYKLEGGRIDPFLAMLHGVLFWFLGWWSLPTTFFSSKKRLLHDIALGTYVAKAR